MLFVRNMSELNSSSVLVIGTRALIVLFLICSCLSWRSNLALSSSASRVSRSSCRRRISSVLAIARASNSLTACSRARRAAARASNSLRLLDLSRCESTLYSRSRRSCLSLRLLDLSRIVDGDHMVPSSLIKDIFPSGSLIHRPFWEIGYLVSVGGGDRYRRGVLGSVAIRRGDSGIGAISKSSKSGSGLATVARGTGMQ